MRPFADLLKDRNRLFFDGATGTQLELRGAAMGPMANVQAPEAVIAVHSSYLEAGAQALLTNTLTANRLALAEAQAQLKVINLEGVKLCKTAAEGRAYVVGDMGPTGQFLQPYGDCTDEQFLDVYREQAAILADAGVDAIAIETMTDLRETVLAVRACREVSTVPVIALMSFDPAGSSYRTMMGVSPEDAAKGMTEAGADAVGSNCGTVGPVDIAEIIVAMARVTDLPLMAEPNAGKPLLSGGQVTYGDISIDEYVAGCERIAEAGASLIGGCCGTGPEHIASVIARLK